MATTLVFKIGEVNAAGETKASWTLDPKWLNVKEGEVPGSKVDKVDWLSPDERVLMVADATTPNDLGKLIVPDTANFVEGEEFPVHIVATDNGKETSLDALLIAEGDTDVTHGEMSATKDV